MRRLAYLMVLFVGLLIGTAAPSYSVAQSTVTWFAPVAPDSVTIAAPVYAGTTEWLTFLPAFAASDPTQSIQQYQWESSTDSGSTWSTIKTGPSLALSLTSGTLEVRCRAANPQWSAVAVSAWTTSANTTYALPAVGGDIAGTLPNPTVTGLQGIALDTITHNPAFQNGTPIYAYADNALHWNTQYLFIADVTTSSNQTLSGNPGTLDGVTPTLGATRVLLTGQITTSENGPWTIQSGAWTRPTWWQSGGQINLGTIVVIRNGTTYGGTAWQETANSFIVDTGASAFTQIFTASGGGGITALTGDVTASGPGSAATTLATVNSNIGTFGDGTHSAGVTVNGKGLVTAVTSNAISGAGVPFPSWSSGTTYSLGQVVAGSDNNLYRSLVNSNLNNNPTTDAGTNWALLYGCGSNLTLNCGVSQTFADTFAASGSPGGAMTPGIQSAISFIQNAFAGSPATWSCTLQQANNPSFTASAAGTATTIKSTTNIPAGASLDLKTVGSGGTLTVGTVTTVSSSAFSGGTYTLTVPTMAAASVSGDVWVYAPYYGTNGITVNLPNVGGNVTIKGSTSTPVCPTLPPSVSFASTGGTNWSTTANANYFAITYTYTDSTGTTRETIPGPATSATATSGQKPTVASFTLPSGITGANLYSNVNAVSATGSLKLQSAFTISGGVAQALTVASYNSGGTAAPTTNPAASTYPCAMMWGSGATGIQVTAAQGLTINGFYLYGVNGGGSVAINSGNFAATGAPVPATSFYLGPQLVTSTWATGFVGRNAFVDVSTSQFDNCATGISTGQLGGIRATGSLAGSVVVEQCTTGVSVVLFGDANIINAYAGFCTTGFLANQMSYIRTNVSNPASGTYQPTYGCTTPANPAFNTGGNNTSLITNNV